jgi:hypothetical protein
MLNKGRRNKTYLNVPHTQIFLAQFLHHEARVYGCTLAAKRFETGFAVSNLLSTRLGSGPAV